MKFILLYYLLSIIIARDNCVEGAGDLSENELKFIADRLYPAECSQLLSYLPGARGTWRTRASDEWITENSRAQCLESLYECNQRGRAVGCTRNWLEAALHKLGRADLASRLKKTKGARKAKRKNPSHKPKTPRAGRSDKEPGKNHKHYSRKKAVTSHAGEAKKNTAHKNNTVDYLLGNRFIVFVVAASILVLAFLGCIVIVSYRRACRCYKNYLHYDYDERNEKRDSFEKSSGAFEESNKSRRSTTSEAREFSDRKKEHTRLVLESDKGSDSPNVRRSKIVSFDSSPETDEEECNCGPKDAKSQRNLSPCARIKRFFDSQKRHVRGTIEDTFVDSKYDRKLAERRKLRRNSGERSVAKKTPSRNKSKNARKKSRKCASARGKRANRDGRLVKPVRSSRKDTETTRPNGCTCEMCKLFNIAGQEGANQKIRSRTTNDAKPKERVR